MITASQSSAQVFTLVLWIPPFFPTAVPVNLCPGYRLPTKHDIVIVNSNFVVSIEILKKLSSYTFFAFICCFG
jgi:hypothetical protein